MGGWGQSHATFQEPSPPAVLPHSFAGILGRYWSPWGSVEEEHLDAGTIAVSSCFLSLRFFLMPGVTGLVIEGKAPA